VEIEVEEAADSVVAVEAVASEDVAAVASVAVVAAEVAADSADAVVAEADSVAAVVTEAEVAEEAEADSAPEEAVAESELEPESSSNPMRDSKESTFSVVKTTPSSPRISPQENLYTTKSVYQLKIKQQTPRLSTESGTHSDPRLPQPSSVVSVTST